MSNKSVIENYPFFALGLCNSWANTYYRSDRDIEEFIANFIIVLIGEEDSGLADLLKRNEAEDDLEFLIELMKEQHIRHNVYKLS